MVDSTDVIVQGWDISLNHGAIVQIRNGELDTFWYYTDKAGSAARSVRYGTRLIVDGKTKTDRHTRSIGRLAWISRWLRVHGLEGVAHERPDYVGLEDYAIRAEQGAHYLGEVGGIARLMLWNTGIHFRLHDPVSVKMFTTHDGTAQKDAIEEAVRERWNVDFSDFNQPRSVEGKQQNRQTSEDLADAFAIAQLVWTEVQLRSGTITMSSLHPKEIQVFNRVTKTNPESLLAREWIVNPTPG